MTHEIYFDAECVNIDKINYSPYNDFKLKKM